MARNNTSSILGTFYHYSLADKKLRCLPLFIAVTGLEPGFISPLENITVAAGRSTQFTCVVKHLGGHKVFTLNIFLVEVSRFPFQFGLLM